MKWAVEIKHTDLDRRNLDDLLYGLGFTLVDGVESPAVTSPNMDRCETAPDAFKIAEELRAAFSGPAKIDKEFELGCVLEYSSNTPKRHTIIKALPLVCEASVSGNVIISPPEGLQNAELKKWKEKQAETEYQIKLENQRALLEPSFLNPRGSKMLELLSDKSPAGEIIYKIYEIAEGHPDNRTDFHKQFGISENEFKRFKDAVHNPYVSGDWARHAHHNKPKTTNPMSISEARSFARNIGKKWLDSVRKNNSPLKWI